MLQQQKKFEKERLTHLVSLFLKNGGNFEDNFPETFKKSVPMYFHEMVPMVQLGDGFHFIEAVFTKEAVNSFRKNYAHLKLSEMRDRRLLLTKWAFQLRQRPSTSCFNSYLNLAVYLIVYDFRPEVQYSVRRG